MKTTIYRALLVSGLLACTSAVAASEQATVSGRDMSWMKQQQDALKEFKDAINGHNVQLPAAQRNVIDRLQQDMELQQRGVEKEKFPAIYFVSLGIPREGLLPMLQDAKRYNVPATLRGLVNNDMRRTAAAMFELAKEDKNVGVQIDPTLYKEYGITAVPAVVVTCPGNFDVIRGSLPLKQALEKVAEKGDCAATARRLLEAAQ